MSEPTTATTSDYTSLEGTAYVVLRREPDVGVITGDHWLIQPGDVPARSAEAAIRKHLNGKESPAGTYVAVPARSWKPVTVQAVQTTVLKLEEAT